MVEGYVSGYVSAASCRRQSLVLQISAHALARGQDANAPNTTNRPTRNWASALARGSNQQEVIPKLVVPRNWASPQRPPRDPERASESSEGGSEAAGPRSPRWQPLRSHHLPCKWGSQRAGTPKLCTQRSPGKMKKPSRHLPGRLRSSPRRCYRSATRR